MCGRFQFSAKENDELRRIIKDVSRRCGPYDMNFQMFGDVLPSHRTPVLVGRNDKVIAEIQTWGIRNQYGKQMINARAETVTERPMFRRSIAAQRCVIPTSGFYEWDGAKHQYYFSLPGSPALYLAGIYDYVDNINCFVILTTAPNASMDGMHDRMPLVLQREQVRPWLTDPIAAVELLATTPPLLERVCMDGQIGLSEFIQ